MLASGLPSSSWKSASAPSSMSLRRNKALDNSPKRGGNGVEVIRHQPTALGSTRRFVAGDEVVRLRPEGITQPVVGASWRPDHRHLGAV